jgi:hypothetical protein
MSNHQQITVVRDTAESNGEVDALAQAQAEAAAAPETPVQETRPGWLPEKFQNPTDLAKAYTELEKKMSSKGVDLGSLDQYSTEFQQNGDLSPESVQKIVAMGIPEPLVRAYVDGQKSVMESNVNTIMSMAGGSDQYQGMVDWAADNIPAEEVDAFNSIIESGNMNSIRMAVAGLKARYEQTNGSTGNRLIQGEVRGPSGGAFESIAQIVEAMRDPRYAKDPAYRSSVEQRVALSNALGVAR